jgi:O-antigen/teichoic acid export membrane protein
MRSATVHRLRPAGNEPPAVRAAEYAAIEDTAQGSEQGLVASILAQASDILSSNSERARTQRNAILAFAVRCASAGLLYLSQIVLARWMGTNDYGIYVFVWTWVLILGGISHLGLNLATISLSPAYRETGDFNLLRGLTRGSRLIALGFGTLVMLAGIAGLTLFETHIENQFVLPMYLALVCVPLYALTDVQDGIGRGNAWMGVALAPPYILRPILILLAMIAAHAFGLPMVASTAAGAAIVATWGAGLVQTLLLNSRLKATVPNGAYQYQFKSWLKKSMPFLVILGCELALQNTDILVISRYLDPAATGIYFAAGKTMALIMFVHYAVGSAVANKFAALNARGDKERLREFVKDAVNWTFWPSLLGAAIILILGKPLLWLFGPQFEAGYPVMAILVVGFLFRSSMGPAEFLLNMLGEQALCATVLTSAAIVNIALNFALVPNFGMIGAAVATSSSLIMAALMNYVVVWRRLEIEIAIWKNLPKF